MLQHISHVKITFGFYFARAQPRTPTRARTHTHAHTAHTQSTHTHKAHTHTKHTHTHTHTHTKHTSSSPGVRDSKAPRSAVPPLAIEVAKARRVRDHVTDTDHLWESISHTRVLSKRARESRYQHDERARGPRVFCFVCLFRCWIDTHCNPHWRLRRDLHG
jgi:uncharacterized alpha-E superfamily protein